MSALKIIFFLSGTPSIYITALCFWTAKKKVWNFLERSLIFTLGVVIATHFAVLLNRAKFKAVLTISGTAVAALFSIVGGFGLVLI